MWSAPRTHVDGEGHDPRDVAQYLLWLGRGTSITPMQLLKLVYISHGWMLGLHGRPLLDTPVEAWTYGPVVPSVYREYKRFGSQPITSTPTSEPGGFDETEKNVMREVWTAYKDFNGLQLSAITHEPNTPWAQTRRGAVISNDLIEEHYRQLAERG